MADEQEMSRIEKVEYFCRLLHRRMDRLEGEIATVKKENEDLRDLVKHLMYKKRF